MWEKERDGGERESDYKYVLSICEGKNSSLGRQNCTKMHSQMNGLMLSSMEKLRLEECLKENKRQSHTVANYCRESE